MGYYGEIAGEVAPKVLDRVASTSGINNPVHERPGALVVHTRAGYVAAPADERHP